MRHKESFSVRGNRLADHHACAMLTIFPTSPVHKPLKRHSPNPMPAARHVPLLTWPSPPEANTNRTKNRQIANDIACQPLCLCRKASNALDGTLCHISFPLILKLLYLATHALEPSPYFLGIFIANVAKAVSNRCFRVVTMQLASLLFSVAHAKTHVFLIPDVTHAIKLEFDTCVVAWVSLTATAASCLMDQFTNLHGLLRQPFEAAVPHVLAICQSSRGLRKSIAMFTTAPCLI